MKSKKTMAWRCLNYGACQKADASEPVEAIAGGIFRCPECGGDDGIQIKGKKPNYGLFGLAGGAAVLLLVLVMLIAGGGDGGGGDDDDDDDDDGDGEVVIVEPLKYENGIDRQVLARPDAMLYAAPEGGATVDPKPNSFERFYVYGDDPQSKRIAVGRTNIAKDGWIEREDTVEWPHSMIVSFEDSQNRHPVLFFRDEAPLQALLDEPSALSSSVNQHYRTIADHIGRGEVLPVDYPVICIEPDHHADQPLIMPVLEARLMEGDAGGARMLKVSAAGEERGATDFQSERYIKLLRELQEAAERRRLSELRVDMDLVFVVDMTGTMQPWVDGLMKAMSEIVAGADGGSNKSGWVRFGLWGYQDKDTLEGIKFRTWNFTSELQTATDFRSLLESVKVNRMTPDSYPEDVFAGVTDAISKTPWREDAQKVILLIGDAPGHTTVKDGARDDFDVGQVRQLASDAHIQIASIAILDSSKPEYAAYHPKLLKQFEDLARNPGQSASSHLSIDQTGSASFLSKMEDILQVFMEQPASSGAPEDKPTSDAGKMAEIILDSARARVVSAAVNESGEVVMPRDITGWVYEMDLLDPSVRSLQPKLLVTRAELNTLVGMVDHLATQLVEAAILDKDFYDELLGAVAGAASGGRSESAGVQLPAFLQGLPYQSDLMSHSAEWFRALDDGGKQSFIASIKAKLNYYKKVYETPSLWRSLSSGGSFENQVAEIPFSQLP
jgi:serine/threonine-protein kinase PpkA